VERVNTMTKRSAVVETSGGEKLVLEVALSREDGMHRAKIHAKGTLEGVREIEDAGASCDGLAAAVTVSLSLLLDEAEKAERARKAEPPPPKPTPRAPRPVPRPKTAAPASSEEPWHVGIGLGGLVSAGLTRAFSPGVTAELDVGKGHWVAGAGALWIPQRELDVDVGSVRLGLWAGILRGCYRLGTEPMVLFCALPAAGVLDAEASGVENSRGARPPWFALGGSVRLQGHLAGGFGWGVEAAVLARLNRESFSIGGVGNVYDPDPVGGWLALTARWTNF
jgi:hypothetical protein